MYGGGSAVPQTAAPAGDASVNSPGPSKQLPPNHPAITPGQTVPAGPLPEGTADSSVAEESPAGSSATAAVSLPSLDPLPAGSKDERTEQKYKNIQILKGLPADRLTKIMFAFKGSLGVECTFCHVKDHFENDDKPEKQTARKMIAMVKEDNNRIGAGKVSCYTCHRGQQRPPQ
jgi:hypothetical protein